MFKHPATYVESKLDKFVISLLTALLVAVVMLGCGAVAWGFATLFNLKPVVTIITAFVIWMIVATTVLYRMDD